MSNLKAVTACNKLTTIPEAGSGFHGNQVNYGGYGKCEPTEYIIDFIERLIIKCLHNGFYFDGSNVYYFLDFNPNYALGMYDKILFLALSL